MGPFIRSRPIAARLSFRNPKLEEQGAPVFLEPEAGSLVDDKVLEPSVEQDQDAFTIADHIEE